MLFVPKGAPYFWFFFHQSTVNSVLTEFSLKHSRLFYLSSQVSKQVCANNALCFILTRFQLLKPRFIRHISSAAHSSPRASCCDDAFSSREHSCSPPVSFSPCLRCFPSSRTDKQLSMGFSGLLAFSSRKYLAL